MLYFRQLNAIIIESDEYNDAEQGEMALRVLSSVLSTMEMMHADHPFVVDGVCDVHGARLTRHSFILSQTWRQM